MAQSIFGPMLLDLGSGHTNTLLFPRAMRFSAFEPFCLLGTHQECSKDISSGLWALPPEDLPPHHSLPPTPHNLGSGLIPRVPLTPTLVLALGR